MKEIHLPAGCTIDYAWNMLKVHAADSEVICKASFNGADLRSTDTLDEAYVKVTGKTKAEFEKAERERKEQYERELAVYQSTIPQQTKEYREKAKGLVLDEKLEEWNKIVPIRLNDLYRGMELQQTLDICEVMRDETVDYNTRLHRAYDIFMNAGHSGMSAALTAFMIKTFCPYGQDVADAVINFRFDKNQ